MASKGKKVASGLGIKRTKKGVVARSSSREDPNLPPLKFGSKWLCIMSHIGTRTKKNPSTSAMSTWRKINYAVNFPTFTPKSLCWDFNLLL